MENKLMSMIGNTPVIALDEHLFAKLEGKNPAGSIKDRAAVFMLTDAIENGELKEGDVVVEATSGNTGIGLCWAARELGFKAKMFMPENMSKQRVDLMKSYGAEVVLTPAAEGMGGSVRAAHDFAALGGAFLANQFENPSNPKAHCRTTAAEIFEQLPSVKWIVAGIGSAGTIMGIKKFINKRQKDCLVCGVEPAESQLVGKGAAGAHGIEGIGANVFPPLLIADELDCLEAVSTEDAKAAAKSIFRATGERVGISSGAAYVAALRVHARKPLDDILVIFPDNGDRYPESLYTD